MPTSAPYDLPSTPATTQFERELLVVIQQLISGKADR